METISQTRIQAKVTSILGSKLDEKATCFKPVKFNISANLEELSHSFDGVSLGFAFVIVTEPKVVKYQVEGRTDIQGQKDQIKKIMSPHPSTKVPMILFDVYQQVYPHIFVLSKMIDAPCPSPELLSTSQAIPSQEKEVPAEATDEPLPDTEEQPVGEEQVTDSDEKIRVSSK